MTFQVKVHKDVIEAMEDLPSLLRAEAIRKFKLITMGGHTFIPPFEIDYDNHGAFTIFANRNRADLVFDNCIILMGYYKDGEYYIDEMRRIKDLVCQTTGKSHAIISRCHISDTKDRSSDVENKDYTVIDELWVRQEISNPFSKKSYHQLPRSLRVAATRMMFVEQRFYESLSKINSYIKTREITGADRSFPYEMTNVDLSVNRFDREFSKNSNVIDIDDFLNNKKLIKQEFRIINWLDLNDDWSGIQRELMGFATMSLLETFPNLKISMVDIVIKDSDGETPYYPNFLKALQTDAPNVPFSTFQSLKYNHDKKVVKLGGRNATSELHVDLFKACRDFSDEIDTKDMKGYWEHRAVFKETYKKNLRGIIYAMYRMSGLATDYATTTTTDIRGAAPYDAYGRCVKTGLEDKSITVTVYGDDDEAFKDAAHACCNAILKGCPAVALLRKDGKNGIVHVADNNDKYYELSNANTPCFFTDVLIHIQDIYDKHQLHDNREKFTG